MHTQGILSLARNGSALIEVTGAFIARVTEERRREERLGATQYIGKNAFLMGRLTVDASGMKRIDLYLWDEHGVERLRLPGVSPDCRSHYATGAAPFQLSITYTKAAGSETMVSRLTFHHASSAPSAVKPDL